MTIENYIVRAREIRDADIGRARRERRNEQVAFYRRMMAVAEKDGDKIKAAERYDKLEGLERAARVLLSGKGKDGAIPLDLDLSKLSREQLVSLKAAAAAIKAAKEIAAASQSASSGGGPGLNGRGVSVSGD